MKIKPVQRYLTLFIILSVCSIVRTDAQGIGSFGLESGWYNPSLNYVDTRGSTASGSEGSVYYGFNVNITEFVPFFIKAGAGYWNSKIVRGNETIKFDVVPLNLDLGFYLNFLRIGNVTPFVSGGVTYNFIHLTYRRQTTIIYGDEQDGKDFSFDGALGFNIPINSGLFVELSYNHLFGGFTQQFLTPENQIRSREVDFNGPMFLISLNYIVK